MNVTLNGEPTVLPGEATVADALAAAGVEPDGRGVAVAIEGEVVPRADWRERRLADGQSVEVVHAVQGG
jgi:sulfur carrier protein